MTWKSLQNAISGTILCSISTWVVPRIFFLASDSTWICNDKNDVVRADGGDMFCFGSCIFIFVFLVHFLIPSFSLGLQTLVAVGVGSVCDT